MSRDRAAVSAYRSLTRLYPRSFREEYRHDLVQLFRDQCVDEPVARVAARAALDLVITIPSEHLEAHMKRTSNAIVPVFFAAIATAGLLLAVLAGTEPVPFFLGVGVALAAGVVAVLSWLRARPAQHTVPAIVDAWWKFLATGLVLLAIGGAQNSFEWGNWYLWIVMVLTAFVLTAIGLVLGLIQLVTHRPHRTSPI